MTEVQTQSPESQVQVGYKPRRVPVQARSRERVDRILDAAAQLLTEQGYNAVKTNHIAKRAGISIGSIYQFFPNRFAIFHALAVRYLDRVADVLSEHIGPEATAGPWRVALDRVLDILAEMWRSDEAFHAVWMAIQNTPELRESDEHYADIFVNDILVHFLRRATHLEDTQRLKTIAAVIFASSQCILDYSMRNGEEQDPMIVEELKLMLGSYISCCSLSEGGVQDDTV